MRENEIIPVAYKVSKDGNKYAIRDPRKVALLQYMGAKVVERKAEDPENIIFILEHEKIVDMVNAIHTGQPHKYLNEMQASDFEKIKTFSDYHREIMSYIRDIRRNRRGK